MISHKNLRELDIYGGGRKRIFIGLLSATCTAICLALLVLLILAWTGGYGNFFRHLCIGVAGVGIILLSWLCIILIFNIHTGRALPGIVCIRHVVIKLFLPPMEIVGRLFGISRDVVRRSFIKVNNDFTFTSFRAVCPNEMLLLLPHCIQSSRCAIRLTCSPANCRHCGKCQIGALLDLSKKFGIRMAIATGGTIARRIVVQCRPKLIVAVACERDLVSGIQDSYPIPVFGLLNERPCGPCMDTLVSLADLDKILAHFTSKNLETAGQCPKRQ